MMSTMGRPARRLFDLEIDEVSAVDRPANQHGLISISKSLGTDNTPEEGGMTIYDEKGVEVFEDELEFGQTVYDEDNNPLVYVPVEQAETDDEATEPVLAGVGKAVRFGDPRKVAGAAKRGYQREMAEGSGNRAKAGARAVRSGFRQAPGSLAAAGGGAALAGAGAAGAGYEATRKSLGDEILEQFSKAVTDADREAIIAKALGRIEATEAENAELRKSFDELEDQRITEAFVSKAADYDLPVHPEVLGPILKAMVEVLDDDQLDVVDRLFTSAGVVYKEAGYTGGALNGGIVDEVAGMAAELVGKSAGALTMEQAAVAVYENSPEAYDEYLRDTTMGR